MGSNVAEVGVYMDVALRTILIWTKNMRLISQTRSQRMIFGKVKDLED